MLRSVYNTLPSLIDQVFNGDMMDWENTNYSATNTSLPRVNIKENKDEFKIEVAAPGMKKNDFNINYDNGKLVIESDVKEEKAGDDIYTRREFSYQSFKRTFTIDNGVVDGDKITAKYEDGILHIALPKREEVKPKPAKQIAIK